MALKANKISTQPVAETPVQLAEGRVSKRRRATRARLLEAAYDVMADVGVDAAKIRDITDLANVGYGNFYQYFETKDDLAKEVLDCIVHDCGVRNAAATKGFAEADPAAVMPTSIRLVIREAASTPIWGWWARRPDLLVDRFRDGFAEFAKKDITQGIDQGFVRLSRGDIDQAWALVCWTIVGGIHDIVVGDRPIESGMFVTNTIARGWGYDNETAERVSSTPLPVYGPACIDWTFKLSKS